MSPPLPAQDIYDPRFVRRIGPAGRLTAMDLSPLMLEHARARQSQWPQRDITVLDGAYESPGNA
jgi:ubiquinone/menaquinone biosynthesis C-methylase UbiE